MLNKKHTLIILFILLFIYSCKKSTNPITPDLGTFIYPLEVGNRWEYDRQVSTFNYRSKDSLNYPRYDDSLNYHSEIVVEIMREKTILDTIKTFVIQTGETDTLLREFWGEHYYKNQSDGLFLYAYNAYGGGSNGLPKFSNSEKIIFNGIAFNSFADITRTLDLMLPKIFTLNSDSLIYNDPPIKNLEYPIKTSNEWIIRESNKPFAINKRVLRKESISLPSRIFSCYKIEWLYDIDNNNEWDENISVVDFISDEGLIKREMFLKDLVITTAESPDGNGYFDWSEEIILKNTNL